MKYRLYIDEVGNSDLGTSTQNANHRYLSLTGIILALDYVRLVVHPSFEALKTEFFDSHPDDPPILHRSELVNRRPPFHALRTLDVESRFNARLLNLFAELEYTVITVAIDKLEHVRRYQTWRFDPYHYCLTILVERYCRWLERRGGKGDVMAESRGGREDLRLKASFENVFERGTDYLDPGRIGAVLTSKQLKVKPKQMNIAGLQLADLIAHPSFKATQARRSHQTLANNFGGRIAEILEESKYDRSPSGEIDGWGRKWLP